MRTLAAIAALLLLLGGVPARAQTSTEVGALPNASALGTYANEWLYLEAGAACDGAHAPPSSTGCDAYRLSPGQLRTFANAGLTFASIGGTLSASQLIAPTTSAFGGVFAISCPTHQFVDVVPASAVQPTCVQPAAGDVSGLAAVATSGSASDLAAGTLAAARGGAGTVNGALKGNGSGAVSQAACADISDTKGGCSTLPGGALEVDSVDLHTATGDVAHWSFSSKITDFVLGANRSWNCSAASGSATVQFWSGPGATGTALSSSATVTAFGTTTLTVVVASNNAWAAGHDVYLNVTSANATALTCNITVPITGVK